MGVMTPESLPATQTSHELPPGAYESKATMSRLHRIDFCEFLSVANNLVDVIFFHVDLHEMMENYRYQ